MNKSPFSGIDNRGHDFSNYVRGHTDNGGSAARFFYCAKASKADRDEGLDGFELFPGGSTKKGFIDDVANGYDRNKPRANHHPTVKPERLMRYLCRLITPPGGIVLDPFMGSGSTGKGAILEGFDFIGIEREADYLAIAQARIEAAQEKAQFMTNQPAAPVNRAQAATENVAQMELV